MNCNTSYYLNFKEIVMLRICLLFFLSFVICADQHAVTTKGKEVLLKKDGTWNYITAKKDLKKVGFRKAKWGMSLKQVQRREKKKLMAKRKGALLYQDSISGMKADIGYIFVLNKLVRGVYMFSVEHSNQNDYISDFKKLKRILTKKYGKPISDKTYWENNHYKDRYERWGMAISLGYLSYYTRYQVGDTEVLLVLNGENYKISLAIEYTSKKLGKLEDIEKEKSDHEKL